MPTWTRYGRPRRSSPNGGLDDALRAYSRDRDAALTTGYRSTLDVARLVPPHERRLALLRAVQSDPELTSTYFDLVAGIGTASDLFTPRLLAAV